MISTPLHSPFLAAVMSSNELGTMIVLCLLYGGVLVHALVCLFRGKRKRPSLNTKTLFLLSVTTACWLRLMCFAGFIAVSRPFEGSKKRRKEYSSSSSRDLEFYARAVIVLFDLPDFMLASTYVLLVVVWAECFLGSRRHWLSSRSFKKTWHQAYFCFNVVLYGFQCFIYVTIFGHFGDGVQLLYVVPAILTVAVPICHFCLYVFLSLRFAGFPTVSKSAARRLRHVTRVTAAWTFSRLAWSAAVSMTFFFDKCDPENPDLNRKKKAACDDRLGGTTQIGNVAIIGLFLFTEIWPFALTLDTGLLHLLEEGDTDSSDKPPNYGLASTTTRLPHSQSKEEEDGLFVRSDDDDGDEYFHENSLSETRREKT